MNRIKLLAISALTAITSLAANVQQNVLQLRDTITDPKFVYPESYEAATHRMKQDWLLKTYTSLETPQTETANTPTTDDEMVARLQAMPTAVEMVFNSIVKGCINRYVERGRGQIERMLGLSAYYMPIFEEALEAEGVPLELRYLPVIESALDPNAVSRAGATGLWQFMLPTAKGLGLEINSLVDERRDPVKSSRMAARYLRQLHDMYDDWSLAIAAYNCGPGNVNKALKRAGEGKKDFWAIYPYLPAETRGYLPGFIAANYAMTYFGKHGISPVLAKRPIITDTIHINKRVHFGQISDVLQIPIEEIRILNPQYRQDVIPGDIKPYALILPSHQTLAYIMSEDSIVSHNAHLYARRGVVEPADGTAKVSDDGDYIIKEVIKYHKVRKGETFASIARKYGVTASSIKRANGIKTLKRGRTIKIVTTKRERRPAELIEAETRAQEVIPVTYDNNAGASAESVDSTTETLGEEPEFELPSVEEVEVEAVDDEPLVVVAEQSTIAVIAGKEPVDLSAAVYDDDTNDNTPAEEDDDTSGAVDNDEAEDDFEEADYEEIIEVEIPSYVNVGTPADEPVAATPTAVEENVSARSVEIAQPAGQAVAGETQPIAQPQDEVVTAENPAEVAAPVAAVVEDNEITTTPEAEESPMEEPTDDEGDDQIVEETVTVDRVAEVFTSRPKPVVEDKPTPSQTSAQRASTQKTAPKPVYVKVKKGETMAKIARKNGMTLSQIQKLNPSVNPSRMQVGDRIRIK